MTKDDTAPFFSGMTKSDQIISSVGDGVTVHDQDFRIIYQNRTMKSIFGDCVGKLCYEAYKQARDVCPDCPVAACFSSGEVHTVERVVSIAEKIFVFETCASNLIELFFFINIIELIRFALVFIQQENCIVAKLMRQRAKNFTVT